MGVKAVPWSVEERNQTPIPKTKQGTATSRNLVINISDKIRLQFVQNSKPEARVVSGEEHHLPSTIWIQEIRGGQDSLILDSNLWGCGFDGLKSLPTLLE